MPECPHCLVPREAEITASVCGAALLDGYDGTPPSLVAPGCDRPGCVRRLTGDDETVTDDSGIYHAECRDDMRRAEGMSWAREFALASLAFVRRPHVGDPDFPELGECSACGPGHMVIDGTCDRDCECCALMVEDRNCTPCTIEWASEAADSLRSERELRA